MNSMNALRLRKLFRKAQKLRALPFTHRIVIRILIKGKELSARKFKTRSVFHMTWESKYFGKLFKLKSELKVSSHSEHPRD